MKKFITVLSAALISIIAFSQSREYKNPFCNFNYAKTFMINGGCTISDGFNVIKNEFNDEVIKSGFPCANIGIDLYGVYADFSFGKSGSELINDKRYANDFFSWHVGVDIPLFKFLRLTPMFGMAKMTYGSFNSEDKYIPEKTLINTFDYGGKIQFNIVEYVNIFCTLTKYNMSFGAGITFPLY